MNNKQVVAILVLAAMLTSGCTGIIDESIEVPDVTLPNDWSTSVSRTASNPQLSGFDDCEELESSLKQSIAEEYRTQILQAAEEVYYYGRFGMDDGIMAESAMDDATASGGQTKSATPPRVEGEDFSGTNNQEEGVDEADFVKTDGYFIYFLNGNRLEILGVPDFGTITYESNFTIEGTPQAMMLDGDRLVVISTVSPWSIPQDSPLRTELGWTDGYQGWRTETLTKFTVL
ncbi:MAG: beta-propeller domain-containing protein, partial [Candidatus Poseidoniales archaeon]